MTLRKFKKELKKDLDRVTNRLKANLADEHLKQAKKGDVIYRSSATAFPLDTPPPAVIAAVNDLDPAVRAEITTPPDAKKEAKVEPAISEAVSAAARGDI